MVEGEGFEPSKAEPADLQSDPFGHSGTPPMLARLRTNRFRFGVKSPEAVHMIRCFNNLCKLFFKFFKNSRKKALKAL